MPKRSETKMKITMYFKPNNKVSISIYSEITQEKDKDNEHFTKIFNYEFIIGNL